MIRLFLAFSLLISAQSVLSEISGNFTIPLTSGCNNILLGRDLDYLFCSHFFYQKSQEQ